MKTRHWPIALLCVLLAPCAFADQFAWVEKSVAQRAASMIPVGSFVRSFCAPCGDEEATAIDVYRVGVSPTSVEGLWEVRLNGRGIDLAYTYVETDGGWRNLALMLGLAATDVPITIGGGALGDVSVELEAAEVELEHLETALTGTVDGVAGRMGDLRAAWLRYRDGQADLEVALTGSPEAGARARLRITRARIAEVEALLELDLDAVENPGPALRK